MLSFQQNSTDVQVIKAGAYCFHLPSAANDIIKHSCRGKLVMISNNESGCHHFTVSKCFLNLFQCFFFFFFFFTTKHTIYKKFSLRVSRAEHRFMEILATKLQYLCKITYVDIVISGYHSE